MWLPLDVTPELVEAVATLPQLHNEAGRSRRSPQRSQRRARSLSPQRRAPKLCHTNGRLHSDPLALPPGDGPVNCSDNGDAVGDADAVDDDVCDLLSDEELLRVIGQAETEDKHDDTTRTTRVSRLRRESLSFPTRTDVRRSISCVDSGNNAHSNEDSLHSPSVNNGERAASVPLSSAPRRFKIFYRDEALRESCAKNTRRMIEHARLARQTSTAPPPQDALASASTGETATLVPPPPTVSRVSNQQHIAWKALRYRKLLGRTDEIDASRLNDPSFDVLECLGVQWCKV
jgi:hypothetical protein